MQTHEVPTSVREFSISVGGSYLFTNDLLPQELPGLEHVGDVVERTETFVFVLVLLLRGDDRGEIGEWK